MKALGERSIASLIRVVLDTVWWIAAVAMAAVTGVTLLSLVVNLEPRNLTMDLPVALELELPIQSLDGADAAGARLEKLRGNLRFPVKNGPFLFGSVVIVLVVLGLFLWVLDQLRQLFRSLSRGQPFIPENVRRIRRVGYAMMAGEVLRALVFYFWSYYSSQHFIGSGLRFIASTEINGTAILAGLAILVIAEVFHEGTRLKDEQSLTI